MRKFLLAASAVLIAVPAIAQTVRITPPSYTITPPPFNFSLPPGNGSGPAGVPGPVGPVGPAGPVGGVGPAGVGIKSAAIDSSGHLIFVMTDGTTRDAGALPSGGSFGTVATTTPSGTTAPVVTSDPTAAFNAKYFPADAGVAAFPSPENSRIVRNPDGTISGRPYLLDKNGSRHNLVPVTLTSNQGYAVNNTPVGGGGSPGDPGSVYNLLMVRQGQVYAQRASGQWQWFNPGMGGMYNSGLPDPFATDAAGNTTSTAATSSVVVPTVAARNPLAPGSSGKTLKVCATGCTYTTLTTAIGAAANGDTVDLGPGTYKETPPAIAVSLKIVWETGAILDGTGLTGSLAHGKGIIVPMNDLLLVNPVITGAAMDQGSAQGTAAIRPETGCNYIDIQGGELYGNQNGVAGGAIPMVLTMTGTYLHDNGLGDGYTHNIYMSGGTIAVVLKDVKSNKPNGGHAVKSRAFNTSISGGTFDATDATAIDIPDGSVAPTTIDGATITKPAGSNNHGVIGYASESATSGLGGMTVTNTTIDAECDNPFIQAGNGSIITLGAGVVLKGTKPTADGTVKGL